MKIDLTLECLFDSKTLFREMALLRKNAVDKATQAFQFIYDNGIQGVLIGGMAVSHWTVDRELTPDVDFMTDDMAKLLTILDGKNMVHQPLASVRGDFEGIVVPELDADFIDADKGNVEFNHYIMNTARPARIGGLTFKVVDPAVQTIMKFDLGRAKDMEDAFKLLQSGNVKKEDLKRHLKALKNYLSGEADAKEIWSYAQTLGVH